MFKCDWLEYTVFPDNLESSSSSVMEFAFETLPVIMQQFVLVCSSGSSHDLEYDHLNGLYFYNHRCVFKNASISVLWSDTISGMGVHVIIPGHVLPVYFDLSEWINKEYRITRFDLACDMREDFHYFYDKWRLNQYIGSAHSSGCYLNSKNYGTLYFGSRGSRAYIRLYDKSQELADSNHLVLPVGEHCWTRLELEARDNLAQTVARYFAFSDFVTCASILNNYVRFGTISVDSKNRSRDFVIDPHYVDLLGSADVIEIPKNSSFSLRWAESVAVPYILSLQDLDPLAFDDFMKTAKRSSSFEKNYVDYVDSFDIKNFENSAFDLLTPDFVCDNLSNGDQITAVFSNSNNFVQL